MDSKIKCFWLRPTRQILRSLRRYTHGDSKPCPGGGWGHSASAVLGQCGVHELPKKYVGRPVHGDLWPHDDPLWPKHCSRCGYEFVDEDIWQFNPDRMYLRVDTQEMMTKHAAPPGAMINIGDWMCTDFIVNRYPDKIVLECKLPDGTWWCVDGRATNGTPESEGWIRTGVVPNITARPSIATPGYHGFLTEGYLDEC